MARFNEGWNEKPAIADDLFQRKRGLWRLDVVIEFVKVSPLVSGNCDKAGRRSQTLSPGLLAISGVAHENECVG